MNRLWPIAGRRKVRLVDAATVGLLTLLPLPLAWTTAEPLLAGVAVVGLAIVAALRVARDRVGEPKRVPWGRPSLGRTVALLAECFVVGPFVGLVMGFAFGFVGWIVARFAPPLLLPLVGLAACLAAADGPAPVLGRGLILVGGTGDTPSRDEAAMTASLPREILRGDVALAVGASLAAGLAATTAATLTAALGADLTTAQAVAPFGLVVGLAYGLMDWTAVGFGGGRRYLVFLLCAPRQNPVAARPVLGLGLPRRAATRLRHRLPVPPPRTSAMAYRQPDPAAVLTIRGHERSIDRSDRYSANYFDLKK